MAKDKYSALWVSHTSMNDFLRCPRLYFLKHVYKDPKTNHKIKIISPPLTLGHVIHEVIEQMSQIPTKDRFKIMPMSRYESNWNKVTGLKGGFPNKDVEDIYKRKGREMIAHITKNPGVISRKAVKLKNDLPYYWLSEEENIILCGKIDWMEYIEESNSLHIIDFKTGNSKEDSDSLQLPIYYLLVSNCQSRIVSKVSYWYLSRQDSPQELPLPDMQSSYDSVFSIARQIKTLRQLGNYSCPKNGCKSCQQMELLLEGKGTFIGVDEYNTDTYVLIDTQNDSSISEIL